MGNKVDFGAKAGVGKVSILSMDCEFNETGTGDTTETYKFFNKDCPAPIRVIDAWAILRSDGPAAGTVLIRNGDGAASESFNTIDALSLAGGSENDLVRSVDLDVTYWDIQAGESLDLTGNAFTDAATDILVTVFLKIQEL